MKVPISWLREFVDVPGSAADIARTMSVRGFAVEGIEGSSDDAVIDFEVTANRPDCMSIIGMAREIATAYGTSLKATDESDGGRGTTAAGSPGEPRGPQRTKSGALAVGDTRNLDIVLDAPDLGPRYEGGIADVAVGPSPTWMQARLHASGIRPISNIVDVTNYVLLELGQPMHAFDFTKIGGRQVRVRRARAGEALKTLDGQTRALGADMLVIADADRAIAVAGVMGGADSEVTATTKTIVLESAYFNPLSVRRTSKAIGLKTEASMRFERGADPSLPRIALYRALELIEKVGAGKPGGTVAALVASPAMEPKTLVLRREKIRGLLGADVPDADVERILTSLAFSVVRVTDGWRVSVPTRRVDILREVDLIEEVARHYGFDRLPVTFPALTSAPPPVDPRITSARRLRSVLTAAGFSEAVTFGFVAEAVAAPFAADGDLVPIANPLSENFAVLRPSALPGLIDAVAHNRRRQQRDVRLFEIGARFSRHRGEGRAVACVWTGAVGGDHWGGGTRDVDFFDIKGVVERIGETARVAVQTLPQTESWLVPGRAAVVMRTGTRVGVVGQLSPTIAGAHGLPAGDPVYVAEVDLDALEAAKAPDAVRVDPLPRFPSVARDISILVDDTLAAADIRDTIRSAAPDTLVRVREFDRYQGKGIPERKVSLSFRLTFRSPDRTLTDAEVQSAMMTVLAALTEKHRAEQR